MNILQRNSKLFVIYPPPYIPPNQMNTYKSLVDIQCVDEEWINIKCGCKEWTNIKCTDKEVVDIKWKNKKWVNKKSQCIII